MWYEYAACPLLCYKLINHPDHSRKARFSHCVFNSIALEAHATTTCRSTSLSSTSAFVTGHTDFVTDFSDSWQWEAQYRRGLKRLLVILVLAVELEEKASMSVDTQSVGHCPSKQFLNYDLLTPKHIHVNPKSRYELCLLVPSTERMEIFTASTSVPLPQCILL